MTMTPARIQDRIEAPPADLAAVRAPSSQPDPMIEPSEMNISALNPTVRRSPVPVVSAGPSAVVDMDLQSHDGDRMRDASEGGRRVRYADGAHQWPGPRPGRLGRNRDQQPARVDK